LKTSFDSVAEQRYQGNALKSRTEHRSRQENPPAGDGIDNLY
jgi:hypothetical protein